jgi:hypothetical protein
VGTNAATQSEAAKINASLGGWAFKLPEDKVTQFVSDRETLLKPADEKPAKPTTAAKK